MNGPRCSECVMLTSGSFTAVACSVMCMYCTVLNVWVFELCILYYTWLEQNVSHRRFNSNLHFFNRHLHFNLHSWLVCFAWNYCFVCWKQMLGLDQAHLSSKLQSLMQCVKALLYHTSPLTVLKSAWCLLCSFVLSVEGSFILMDISNH